MVISSSNSDKHVFQSNVVSNQSMEGGDHSIPLFSLTPLYKHRDISEDDHDEIFANTAKQNKDGMGERRVHGHVYKRKVLSRIVTPLPYSILGVSDGDAENEGVASRNCGEIEACIEEFIEEPACERMSSRSNSNSFSNSHSLFRRVAVRSYGGGAGAVVHATFSIPFGPLPGSRYGRGFTNSASNDGGVCSSGDGGINGEGDNWMCWTAFNAGGRSSMPNGSDDDNGYKKKNDKRYCSGDSSIRGKRYLCVLSNPSTLRIYDVYPNAPAPQQRNKSNSTENENHNAILGDCQVVSLPFEACAIFSLPFPHGGLLIQRAVTTEDIPPTAPQPDMTVSESLHPCDDIRNHIMMDSHNIHTTYDNNNITSEQDDDSEFQIKGPPTTVRLGLNSTTCTTTDITATSTNKIDINHTTSSTISPGNQNRLQPRSKLQSTVTTTTDTFLPSSSSSSADTPPIQTPVTAAVPGATSATLEDHAPNHHHQYPSYSFTPIPALYTLRHALDEVRPCTLLPSHITHPNLGVGGSIGNNASMSTEHFTSVFEKVVKITQPRSFYGNGADSGVVVVTYHSVWKRHAFWSLGHAPDPPKSLPLWKRTALALGHNHNNDRYRRNYDIEEEKETLLNGSDVFRQSHGSANLTSTGDAGNTDQEQDGMHSLVHLNIHSDISLTCIHTTTSTSHINSNHSDVGLQHGELHHHSKENMAKAVFLSSNVEGSGNYTLCLLQPKDGEKTNNSKWQNDCILRSYILEPKYKCVNDGDVLSLSWEASHLIDVPCLSAQPLLSTPITLPQVSWKDDTATASSAATNLYWNDNDNNFSKHQRMRQTVSETPLATDVLICRVAAEDEEGSMLDSGSGSDSGMRIRTRLSLFRANLHIVDCAVPLPPGAFQSNSTQLTSSTSIPSINTAVVTELQNPVADRIDLICVGDDQIDKIVIRASLSLVMKNSPIAEGALLAIESALSRLVLDDDDMPILLHGEEGSEKMEVDDTCQEIENSFEHSSFDVDFTQLSFHIRADCARFLQTISNELGSSLGLSILTDDIGWTALATLIYTFIDAVVTNSSSKDVLEWMERMQDEGEFDEKYYSSKEGYNDDDDSNWVDLLRSDFHHKYYQENKDRFLLGCAGVEDNRLEPISEDESLMRSFMKILPSSLGWLVSQLKRYEEGAKPQSIVFVACTKVFDALHMLYEDSKLSRKCRGFSWIRSLGRLLFKICNRIDSGASKHAMIMGDFTDHYWRDLGDHLSKQNEADNYFDCSTARLPKRITTFLRPPSFFEWLENMMLQNLSQGSVETAVPWLRSQSHSFFLNGACSSMRTLKRLFSILFGKVTSETEVSDQSWKDRLLVIAMVREGITNPSDLSNKFTAAIAIPLMEVLYRCRLDPPVPPSVDSWPTDAYNLIDRSDLAQIQISLSRIKGSNASPLTFHGGGSRAGEEKSLSSKGNFPQGTISLAADDPDKDGLTLLDNYSSMMFPNDNRIHEAARLVRSSRPIFLRVHRAVEVSDHDFERMKQEKLLMLCRRILALPLGRGMMTMGTLEPLPAEPMPIPTLCLAGRVPPTNATLSLDISNCSPDMSVWPDFHNGVAAGLRLPCAGEGEQNGTSEITRTWIVYNKPSSAPQAGQNNNTSGQNNSTPTQLQPNHAHGGLLMALGLRGHLSALSMTDVYQYLTQGAVTTTVGILLGMSANKRGTCDPSVSKMLCLHIPSLLPPSFAAMDVASPAQVAAVSGIGLLYQGSSHRLMTEFLLNEMGKKPTNDQNTNDREGYTLALGIALGMVNLSHAETSDNSRVSDGGGGGSAGLADLHIEERLHRYIVGGRDDTDNRQRADIAERGNSGTNFGGVGGENDKCSRIFEGDMINTDITAPAATLALGLMHLRSGNKTIASMLALPDTFFLLDYVRPDFLFLRVVARSLVLWDDVEPSEKWITSQIPPVVRKSYEQFGKIAKKTTGLAGLATFAAMSMGASSDDKSEHAGEENETKVETVQNTTDSGKMPEIEEGHVDIDRQAIRQANAYIVSGACFGLGLRFAGTGNTQASAAIFNQAMELLKLRDENDPVSLAQRPERPIIEMCLGSVAISLAMVMSGTGDLDTFRLLRMLRWKCDDSVKYGSHMAFGASIGLLFLGGGTCTLGREPADIAALVMAFFPRFPSCTSDNQYHLQALRHCYALAVRRRMVEAVDIDTGEHVFVPLQIQLKNKCKINLNTPCLLLDKGPMSHIRVVSERYFPVKVDLRSFSNFHGQLTLYVKKKSGHLSHMQDPHSFRSLLIQTGGSSSGSALELIQSFTEDPKLLAYANFLCLQRKFRHRRKAKVTNMRGNLSHLGVPSTMEEFCTEILHECLTQEKPESIPLYLALHNGIATIEKKTWPVGIVWDLRLLRSFYENKTSLKVELLSFNFIAMLCETIDRHFASLDFNASVIPFYHADTSRKPMFSQMEKWVGSFLIWSNVPYKVISSEK